MNSSSEFTGLAALLYLFAFFSGAAALIYEVTWAKMLALTFGGTTLAAAAVIAGFLGGMGLGARAYHHFGERTNQPLRIYGLLELGIALVTAGLSMTFYSLPEVFAGLSRHIVSPAWLGVIRFAGVFGLLLVPSALMGATFPALCEAMIHSAKGLDRRLGFLYGINTIGGAAGVLIGALLLVDQLGLTTTVRIANGLNLIVGFAAIALVTSRRGRRLTEHPQRSPEPIPSYLSPWMTGAVLFLSGLTTLAYEILWFRALRFLIGNSTHALGVVLMIFLVGLGGGSLLLRRVLRRGSPEKDLALCQLLIGCLGLWAMVCIALVLAHPEIYQHVSIFLPEVRLQPWGTRVAIIAVVSAVTMLPATLFMGLSFPLASRLFIGSLDRLGARIGLAYLLANLGSIAGATLAAIALLPALGVMGGTLGCAAVNLLLAFTLTVYVYRRTSRGFAEVAYGTLVIVILAVAMPSSLGLLGEESVERWDVVFARDEDQGSVHVIEERSAGGDPTKRVMLIDGTKIGCSIGFSNSTMYGKQAVLAHLPMALFPSAKTAMTVGLGSGSTVQTLVQYPQLASIECIEINKGVIDGSRLFPESAALADPRVRLIHEDAVHYLLRCGRRFDLIISDGKQDPFYSGNAVLLCREYYEYSRAALQDNGLFAQWLPLATLSSDFEVILRTTSEVFPHLEAFFLPPDSIFLIASSQPIWDSSRGRLQGDIRDLDFPELSMHGLSNATELFAIAVADGSQIRQILSNGPVSTWDRLILDYAPFKADPRVWRQSDRVNLGLLLQAGQTPRTSPVFVPSANQQPVTEAMQLFRSGYFAYLSRDFSAAAEQFEQALSKHPDNAAIGQWLVRARRANVQPANAPAP